MTTLVAAVLVGLTSWTTAPAEVVTRPGRTFADSAAPPRTEGAAVALAAVGIDAPLDPIRFRGSVLDPPSDVHRVGWWADGTDVASARGDRPTVLAGHVSDGRDRPGAFASLHDVRVGMTVVTRDADDRVAVWRVARIRTFAKDELPRETFLPAGRRVLRLITCDTRVVRPDGRFHYEDNLVVEAEPVSGTPGPQPPSGTAAPSTPAR
ncbi:MAG: class F sortase [Aeromicrobium erythreum]